MKDVPTLDGVRDAAPVASTSGVTDRAKEKGQRHQALLPIDDEHTRDFGHHGWMRDRDDCTHKVATLGSCNLYWFEEAEGCRPQFLPVLLVPGVVPLKHGDDVMAAHVEQIEKRAFLGFHRC